MDLKDFIKTATLTQLERGLKNKEFSSVELTSAYLERAKNLNGQTNAFITIDEEYALKSAKQADELIKNGKAKPLTGIPLSVKDNIFSSKHRPAIFADGVKTLTFKDNSVKTTGESTVENSVINGIRA